MKLCSSESSCGYSASKKVMPELILQISKDGENFHHEQIIKVIVDDLIKEGYYFTFYTNHLNSKYKNSLSLVLIASNNKEIKIYSNPNQTSDLTVEHVSKIRDQIKKNLSKNK